MEVAASLQRARRHVDVIVGGRYGLGSKDFTPAQAMVSSQALCCYLPGPLLIAYLVLALRREENHDADLA